MRGRKPQPKQSAIRATTGGFPKPPKGLTKPALAEWKRIKAAMGNQLIGNLDATVLQTHCEDVATYNKATTKIAEEGEIVLSSKGHPLENPWLWIQARAKQGLLKSAAELGLTPVARTRVAAQESEASSDSIESFMTDQPPIRLAQ